MTDLQHVNLNRLAIFVAVVETGSMTSAAERLGLAKTVVSSHMQRLEAEIGASLLHRTTRRLSVTDSGKAFYQACRQIIATAESAIADAAGRTGPLRGALRVSAPIDYGSLVVAPALVALRAAQPALEIELACNDRYVDLIAERVDVAIRLGRLQDSNHRAVRLGSFVKWLVASPGFVKAWGQPRSPLDLAGLPCVALSILPRPHSLTLRNGQQQQQTLRCTNLLMANTAHACRAAVLAGGGFGLLTDFSVREDVQAGRLVRLLPDWETEAAGIQAIFPPTSHPPPKVMAFIDALRGYLEHR
ncbi:LysR family transcriptional regulator [Cupriavidus sp. 2TAF22]|uniref:LysR family transcriptional regulator n=1 Tax=unclassified Cupriavidus TaxID=2640874 RepID=UPI003F90D9E4